LTFKEKIEKPYSSQDEIAEKGKIIEVRNYPTFTLKTTRNFLGHSPELCELLETQRRNHYISCNLSALQQSIGREREERGGF